MLRKMFFSLAVMGLAATSQAAVMITVESSPTVDMPGFTSYVLTATEDSGDPIIGFDFVGDGTNRGFFGPMNHVVVDPQIPLGATVWTDSNSFFGFVGADVSQDSQFSVASNTGVTVGPSEGSDHLQGAFNWNAANISNASSVWQFARLAIADGASATVEYNGAFTVRSSTSGDRLETVTGMIPMGTELLPDIELMVGGMAIAPDGSVDFGVSLQGAALQRTFSIENTGDADLVLDSSSVSGNFSFVGAFPTTIGAGAMADFVIAGDTSNLGPLSGLLSFSHNVDGVAAFSVDLSGQVVPEPSTFALAGLAMVGLVGFARRRK